jgi:predicted outer membrane repeat protein
MLRMALIVLLCAGGLCAQTTHTVMNLDDTGPGSLRETVAAAASGDTVVFHTTLAGTVNVRLEIDLGQTALTIIGNVDATGAPTITLDGNSVSRLFKADAELVVENLIFANGNADSGGAISNPNDVTCVNCIFLDNTAIWMGGGIHSAATVTCIDCVFQNNTAGTTSGNGRGGAIHNWGPVVCTRTTFKANTSRGAHGAVFSRGGTFTDCTFTDNFANLGDGGAVGGSGEPFSFTDCTFTGNTTGSSGTGGAIWVRSDATFANCTFSNNVAGTSGGAVNGRDLVLTSCTFVGNTAGSFGGAILSFREITCVNCTFSANTAGFGGAIASYSSLTCESCTFSDNAADEGGAIRNQGGEVSLRNCILAGDGPMFDGDGLFVSGGFNLCVLPSAEVPWLNATGDLRGTDPMLGPLQDNGGPVHTMLPDRQSPVIDAGGPVAHTTDARGLPRTVEIPSVPNAPGGDGTDIGAVERQNRTTLVEVFIEQTLIAAGSKITSPESGAAGASLQLTVVVGNNAGAQSNLMLSHAPTISNEFKCTVVVTSWPTGALTPGTADEIVLEVTPETGGQFSFELTVESNDEFTPAYTITIQRHMPRTSTSTAGCVAGGGSGGLVWLGLLAVPALLGRRVRRQRLQ